MREDLVDMKADNHDALVRVLTFLSCCHTIIIDKKKGTYNASSPDELALVNAAKQFGYEFTGFDEQNEKMIIHNRVDRETIRFELLNVCEFTSTRKRMSVIVKDKSGKIRLMCKGADSVILDRMSEKSRQGRVLQET